MANQSPRTTPARPRPPQRRNYSYQEHVLTLESLLECFNDLCPRDYGQWTALCPAHADTNPSLSISIKDGRVLMHCHSGCGFDEICEALDVTEGAIVRLRVTEDDLNRLEIPVSCTPNRIPIVPLGSRAANSGNPAWAARAEEFSAAVSDEMLDELADSLDVATAALRRLSIGWCDEQQCWTFPERDGRGRVVGISTRYPDGQKRFLSGGHRGLYLPAGWQPSSGQLLIVEGASDTAAGLTAGLNVVGRPSCTGGVKHLIELLRDAPVDCNIVVVGEMDARSDGSWPGKDGAVNVAEQLASQLARPVSWVLPPKDSKDRRCRRRSVESCSRDKPSIPGHGRMCSELSDRHSASAPVSAGC